MTKLRDYQHDLIEDLGDPREAAEYLDAALEDGDCAVVPMLCAMSLRRWRCPPMARK